MTFRDIKIGVAEQFKRMSTHELFRTTVSKDLLWSTYLASFPEGSNPVFREKTEHDCSCCKQFIRAVGDVVAVINGKVESIWDGSVDDAAYKVVASKMSQLVKAHPIEDVFLHSEPKAGTDKNFEDLTEGVKTWEHFFLHIPNDFVCKKAEIGGRLGEARTRHDTLLRSLKEITPEAVETVLDLIAQNSLYRGEEKKSLVQAFQKMKRDYVRSLVGMFGASDLYVWSQINGPNKFVCGIRNDVIGTLLVDLSEGVDLERAVASFEAKVAPTNYRRPTALITKAMIDKAKQTVEDLGLTSALERRYATLTDITADNILFANRDARKHISSGVFDDLAATAPASAKSFDKVEEVPIDKFITNILPKAESLEVMFENRHAGNLLSLVAPVDPTARPLFKWPNGFSWSYNGEVADSIKERVKQAGGNVAGDICCRLAWFNYDDLDLHMKEVRNRYEISFANRQYTSPSGGRLDVDMNAGGGHTRTPVENIFYERTASMQEGQYELFVHNYCRRESIDVGFEVEIDILGTVHRFVHARAVPDREAISVATLEYTKSGGVKIVKSLPSVEATRTVWGLTTQAFHKVNVMLMSPNHWNGGAVGNKHYFFMLDGCQNDGKARGFFNEFLRGDLEQHRKVLEVVGAKMKTEESSSQLSGLGFSSTQHNSVLCKVKGSFTRTVKIVF